MVFALWRKRAVQRQRCKAVYRRPPGNRSGGARRTRRGGGHIVAEGDPVERCESAFAGDDVRVVGHIQHLLAPHQPKQSGVRQREIEIGVRLRDQHRPAIAARHRFERVGQRDETFGCDRSKQSSRIAKMMRRRGGRHTGSACRTAQRKSLRAGLRDHRRRRRDQRRAEIAMMVTARLNLDIVKFAWHARS